MKNKSIKLTDYQANHMKQLAAQRQAIDNELKNFVSFILDSHKLPTDTKVSFDMEKEELIYGL